MSVEIQRGLTQLELALQRLREALAQPESNPLWLDGTIQRFEFTIELAWRALKKQLAHEGIDTRTPREALERAFQSGWLGDEETWLKLLSDRNLTAHTYNQAVARQIYADVKAAMPELEAVLALLRRRAPAS